MELIPINNENGNKTVSARELYNFLEVKTKFTDWCNRMFEYGFVQDIDFEAVLIFEKHQNGVGGTNKTDYAITLDTAKEIAMIQRSEKGKIARRYFIEVEKKAKQLLKPTSTLDILKLTISELEQQQKGLAEVKEEVRVLKAQTQIRPDFFTVAGYGTLNDIKVNLSLASKLGRKASKICRDRNIETGKIRDPRFGTVKTYPTEVLEEVFNAEIN